MHRITKKKFSANEKQIAELLKENEAWKVLISEISQEIHFLQALLSSGTFDEEILESSRFVNSRNELKHYRAINVEFIREVHNHKNDIQGMIECEDIGCEIFYHEEHMKLGNRIRKFREQYTDLKLRIFSETEEVLKSQKQVL